MSKKFVFRLALGLSFVIVAVFYLLNVMNIDGFGFFNLAVAVAIWTGVAGGAFLLYGLFGKNPVPLKKLYVFVGAGLLVVTALAVINHLAIDNKIILPVILVILSVAAVISVIAVGGKKWDEGDNQKAGYKNYYQRKAEEEAKKSKGDDE